MIRGLAVGEIRLRDTGRVLARELASGFLLGVLLGTVGFGRVRCCGGVRCRCR